MHRHTISGSALPDHAAVSLASGIARQVALEHLLIVSTALLSQGNQTLIVYHANPSRDSTIFRAGDILVHGFVREAFNELILPTVQILHSGGFNGLHTVTGQPGRSLRLFCIKRQ